MENSNQSSYIKVDGNAVINEKYIRWIYQIDKCMEICWKNSGCLRGNDTFKLCKSNNPDSYNKLIKKIQLSTQED